MPQQGPPPQIKPESLDDYLEVMSKAVFQSGISWRSPIVWPVFIPYVFVYLASLMFYWIPLGNIRRELLYIYAVLFIINSFLNITSHAW